MSRPTSPRKLQHTNSYSLSRTPTSSFPSTPVRNPTFDYITSALESSEEIASPTKALALSRLQHEVAQIQIWLESLFAPAQIPAHLLKWRDEVFASASSGFEAGLIVDDGGPGRHFSVVGEDGRFNNHGSGVLDSLKSLRQENLAADHMSSLIYDAQVEELHWLKANEGTIAKERGRGVRARMLMDQILKSLSTDGSQALKVLGDSAAELGLDLSSEGSTDGLHTVFALKILEQAHQNFVLQQQITELESLHHRILTSQPFNRLSESTARSDVEAEFYNEGLERSTIGTAQLNRDTKQINLRIMEYEDRVRGLERQLARTKPSTVDLQEITNSRERVSELKSNVKESQVRFARFNRLTPDLAASEIEMKRSVHQLEDLRKRRKDLLEKIGFD